LQIIPFLGSFHPVLVHLPIGILIVALLLEWLSRKSKYASVKGAIPVIFFAAALTAIMACMTGYWLSLSGEYDEVTLGRHKWMGIITALLSSMAYVLKQGYLPIPSANKIYNVFCVALSVLIVVTGHLGGNLTHGSGYLVKNLPEPLRKTFGYADLQTESKPIPDVQEAAVYDDLVARVIQKKCISCHGPDKQKGGLRLDTKEWIDKGGKDGKILTSGSPEQSELIKRLLLPVEDEDHMPPKEKNQLTENEIALLHWWIKQGPQFDKQVKDIAQNDTIKKILLSFQDGNNAIASTASYIPSTAVAPVRQTLADSLKKAGVLLQILSPGNNYISASFINMQQNVDSVMPLIAGLKDQLIILRLSGKKLSDSSFKYLSGLTELRRLYLDRTTVTDTGIVHINSLEKLQYLNLVGTGVSAGGLKKLTGLKSIQSIFLYQSRVGSQDYDEMKRLFPGASIDTGGYIVPILASDTTEFKPPKKAKPKKE
jgi:uncharacterized membrane protein/mono/diheme cytochrome c family protein